MLAACGALRAPAAAADLAGSSANVALASNGGVATAGTSSYAGYPAAHVNDGDSASFWASASAYDFPHRIKVDWGRLETLDQVHVRTTDTYGIVDFQVQYWIDGAGWADLPGGVVRGNASALRTFTFPAVTTRAVRVYITGTADGFSRVAELAAFRPAAGTGADPAGTTANVALSANGGTATAHASYAGHPAEYVNDGNAATFWASAGAYDYPHRIKVDWGQLKTIGSVEVRTPDGQPLNDFHVQYWIDQVGWADVPGGSVIGNQASIRTFPFAPLTTRAVRLLVGRTPDGFSRVSALSAFEAQLTAPAQSPPVAGQPFKVGYWNLQYGTGTPAMTGMGGTCSPAPTNQYGQQAPLNAWGVGHVQSYLDRHVRSDPSVIAFGGSEVANAFSMSFGALSGYLGWPGIQRGEEVLFARHGFKHWEARNLPACGGATTGVGALYMQAWRTADGWRINDFVHVFSTHFRHPDAGNCRDDVQGVALRQWIAQVAGDGRPVVVVGDLNTIVENSVDPRIQAFAWYQSVLMPQHMDGWRQAGFADAYRTLYPSTATHPGMTSTWHSGPYYGLWKRIDYALVRGAAVAAVQLFNDRTEGTGSVYNCTASDHAGIVVALSG